MNPLVHSLIHPLVKGLELLYRGVNRARRMLYRRGLLRPRRLTRPVISVGNVSAGGAGKTPATIAIARYLLAQGHRVAVLTRGYGRTGSGGRVTALDPAHFGDEPVLIKKLLPNAEVIVGKNRFKIAQTISTDIFILDDGFQHLQLHRDVDVVIEAPHPTLRREGDSALRYADVVLRRDLRLSVPERLRGKPLLAFSGLADNEQFFASLRAAGLQVVATRSFRDHYRYRPSDVEALKAAAREAKAEAIVTTEKDAVKIADSEIIAIPAEMVIDPQDLERILTMISR